jgi:hypothetical protein
LQHDPYDQFASGYVGMGNDPGNGTDPSGGTVNPLPSSVGEALRTMGGTLNNVTVIAKVSTTVVVVSTQKAIETLSKALDNLTWTILGFSAAISDNAFGTHLVESNAPSPGNDAADYWRAGVTTGNGASIALAVAEGGLGESLMTGGALAVSTAPSPQTAVVGGVGMGVGYIMTVHHLYLIQNALNNTIKGAGQVKYESKKPPPTSGETNATKTGRHAHDNYNPGAEYKVDRQDTKLENGKYPDAIDDVNDIVRELKPNNKRKIKEGERQVRKYADQLEKQTRRKFKTVVDTYDVMPDGTIKYNYGTPK